MMIKDGTKKIQNPKTNFQNTALSLLLIGILNFFRANATNPTTTPSGVLVMVSKKKER